MEETIKNPALIVESALGDYWQKFYIVEFINVSFGALSDEKKTLEVCGLMLNLSYNTWRITNTVVLVVGGLYILGFFRNFLDKALIGSISAAVGLGIYVFVIAHRIWMNK